MLHGRAYQNTSMIVDVFTRSYGRLSLLAKGAKRPGSAMYGTLLPLQCLFLSWGGRSELKTLYSAEIESKGQPMLDGDHIYLGMYLNELLVRLLHKEEAHAQMFDYYQHCLQQLSQDSDNEIVLRYFELQLLEELGYAVNLQTTCDTDNDIEVNAVYAYLPERGFICQDRHQGDELLVQGQTIQALAGRNLSGDQQKKEAKLLLRSIIEYHLDGSPLKTRELFQQKKRFQQPG